MRPITFLAALVAALVLQAAFATNAGADVGWAWPVRGDVVTRYVNGDDPYAGGQHRGIDIAAPVGTPVVAAVGGRVTFAGSAGSSGVTVSMRSADGRYDVSYLHLSSVAVRQGAEVGRGERVGAVGTSGRRSVPQPHLHFGVREAGSRSAYIDPLDLLPPIAPPAAQPRPPAPAPVPSPAPIPPATSGLIPVIPTRPAPAPRPSTGVIRVIPTRPAPASASGSTSAPARVPAVATPGGALSPGTGGAGAALGAEAAVVAAPPVTPAAAVTEPAAATAAAPTRGAPARAATPAGPRSAPGFEPGTRSATAPRDSGTAAAASSRDSAAGGVERSRSAGAGGKDTAREPVTPPARPLRESARSAAPGGDSVVRLPTTRATPPDDGFDPGWLAALVGCVLAACCLGRPDASSRAARGGAARLASWLRPLAGRG